MTTTFETILINGNTLKRRVLSTVSDTDARKAASKNPHAYNMPGSDRPNMFKARDAAQSERFKGCHDTEPWLREIITRWCQISGHPPAFADFWQEKGFMAAIKEGRDIQIRTYLDDDGWAWIVIRDIPSYWLNRKRLPEGMRLKMIAAARRRGVNI